MSTCPQCYTGTCRRHRAQDHGRSQVKSVDAESTLQKMYDQLVGAKLQKLQAEASRDPDGQHSHAFRKKLDASRDKTLRKGHKRSKLAADVTGSGLNPQALAAVYGDSDEDAEEDEKEKRKRRKDRKKHAHKHASYRKRKHRSSSSSESDSDSSESSASDDSRRRHRKRKHSHKKSYSHKKHKRSRADSE